MLVGWFGGLSWLSVTMVWLFIDVMVTNGGCGCVYLLGF